MKKIKKVMYIIFLIILLLSFNNSFADDSAFEVGKDAFNSTVSSKADKMIKSSATLTITIVRIAGVSIAVVMLLVIAMKYMMSSAGDRADIKKHAVAYVVGAVMLFAATGILGLINEIAGTISE